MAHVPSVRLAGILFAVVLIAAAAFWALTPVVHPASAENKRDFQIAMDFDKFRQIMVRKNATTAIVEHSGMRLLDEQILNLGIETTTEKRPLLKALLGKSNAELVATKQIVVELNDPQVDANQLELTQVAEAGPASLIVSTTSDKPAGNLQDYQTLLTAQPKDSQTFVSVTIRMSIDVSVPRIFTSRADQRVADAAREATSGLQSAIESFVARHADELIILPDL